MTADIESGKLNKMNTDDAIYFNFSYAALKLLGKNLYSNAANAISELVANGLDAKAKNVYVYIDMSDKAHSAIEIIDDGTGMDYDDLARKYVWVGRNKREDEELVEEEKDSIMGRKGIGKLAALYLSNNYYIVTKKNSKVVSNQWEINLSKYDDSDFPRLDRVNEKITLTNNSIWEKISHGTAIILNNVDLRRNGAKRIEALKRVFADFYLVDELSTSIYVAVKTAKNENISFEKVEKSIAFKNIFAIYDNTDHGYHKKIRDNIAFTWASKYEHIANEKRNTVIWEKEDFEYKGKGKFEKEDGTLIEKEYELKGWIGIHSTINPKNAKDDNYIRNNVYNPNRLRLYVRNKLAVGDLFEVHQSTQAMSNYIEGDISFDILDDDDLPDIATSSRQDFLEDERVELLFSIVDPIVNSLFSARNEIGNIIRKENDDYEEYLKKQEEKKLAREKQARRKAEMETEKAEQEKEKAEKKAKKEQQRAQYILNVSGVEDKNIMNTIHSIYNMSCRVKNNLDELNGLIGKSEKGKKKLEKASVSNQRILSISKIISKAGRIVDKNDALQDININSFIKEYIKDVLTHVYEKRDIDIVCDLKSSSDFKTKIKPLSFIMMIDNIIGNAIKANASALRIVDKNLDNEYIIFFIDNGCGIDGTISKIDSLFEFGVTTTDGSGLGLFYAKRFMDESNGEIDIIPNKDKGVSVVLKFKK